MKKLLSGVGIALVLFCLGTLLAGNYMLRYGITPDPHGLEDLERTRFKADTLMPGSIAWYDSLKTLNILKDHWISGEDGYRLHACSVPAPCPSEAKGTAIVVHGHGDSHYVFLNLVRMYRDSLHFNVLFPDLQFHGYSDGDEIQMGWKDRLDLKRWIAVAHQLFGGDFMVLHGVSMGGATVMMTSGEQLPEYVRCFVEDCGYSSVYGMFAKGMQDIDPRIPTFILYGASVITRIKYGWWFSEADCRKALSRCERPMLFIHGEEDELVPFEHLQENYNAKTKGYKEYWAVPDARHTESYYKYPQEYIRRLSAFFETVHKMIEDGSINY